MPCFSAPLLRRDQYASWASRLFSVSSHAIRTFAQRKTALLDLPLTVRSSEASPPRTTCQIKYLSPPLSYYPFWYPCCPTIYPGPRASGERRFSQALFHPNCCKLYAADSKRTYSQPRRLDGAVSVWRVLQASHSDRLREPRYLNMSGAPRCAHYSVYTIDPLAPFLHVASFFAAIRPSRRDDGTGR